MTTIMVSALIADGEQRLLAQGSEGVWDLPGGVINDAETTEEALARVFAEKFGLRVEDEEFFETFFEGGRLSSEQVVRNVYLVRSWGGEAQASSSDGLLNLRWFPLPAALGLPLGESARAVLQAPSGLNGEQLELGGAPILILARASNAEGPEVGLALCARLGQAAYIDAQAVRSMVVARSPSVIQSGDAIFDDDVQDELQLANVAALAQNFAQVGLSVVIDLPVETQAIMNGYLESLIRIAPVHLVILSPEDERPHISRAAEEACVLRLDISGLVAEDAASTILANLGGSRVHG